MMPILQIKIKYSFPVIFFFLDHSSVFVFKNMPERMNSINTDFSFPAVALVLCKRKMITYLLTLSKKYSTIIIVVHLLSRINRLD